MKEMKGKRAKHHTMVIPVCISTFQNRVYTKPCIHPFSSENRVYTLLYTHHNFAQITFYNLVFCSYCPFSAPQAPPNAIFRHRFQFPLISDTSGDTELDNSVQKTVYTPSGNLPEPCIHQTVYTPFFLWKPCIQCHIAGVYTYTRIHIHTVWASRTPKSMADAWRLV